MSEAVLKRKYLHSMLNVIRSVNVSHFDAISTDAGLSVIDSLRPLSDENLGQITPSMEVVY